MAILEHSGSRITKTESIKLMFSLIVTFYLTKASKRTKTSLTQLSHYRFELRYYFRQRSIDFFSKIADISKIKKVLVLKVVFSKATYLFALMHQI